MMLSATLAFLSLLVSTSLATPVETSAAAEAVVLTLHGWRPAADVHAIPAGGSVRVVNSEVHLLDASGAVVRRDAATDDQTTADDLFPYIGDAIAYALWNSTGDTLRSFDSSWAVPSDPVSYDNQTLFYFHSMFGTTIKHTIEPVLQYGPSAAGGGEGWSTVIWYRIGSKIYHTSAVGTTSGANLKGLIVRNDVENDLITYTGSFEGGDALTIQTNLELTSVANGLTVHNVTNTENFPTGNTVFYDINVTAVGGDTPQISWYALSDPTYEIDTVVNVQGATNAKATMTYSASA